MLSEPRRVLLKDPSADKSENKPAALDGQSPPISLGKKAVLSEFTV